MASNEVHVGDIGTIFRVTVLDANSAIDISGATTRQLIFQKPDGSTLTRSGSLTTDGTDGKLEYASVSGDLDMAGRWSLQVYLVLATWEGKSDIGSFIVYPNLS